MNIISEILETDSAAEETLAQAEERRKEILAECDSEIERIKAEAKQITDEYRQEKQNRIDSRIKEQSERLRQGQEDKVKSFDKLYLKNHEQWEKEILGCILNGIG
ncbi:MAG: hypothetical protein Q4E74_01570 [Ruminococcus sp.]|nr:hypothetical protein [Ruminococcus sp.]